MADFPTHCVGPQTMHACQMHSPPIVPSQDVPLGQSLRTHDRKFNVMEYWRVLSRRATAPRTIRSRTVGRLHAGNGVARSSRAARASACTDTGQVTSPAPRPGADCTGQGAARGGWPDTPGTARSPGRRTMESAARQTSGASGTNQTPQAPQYQRASLVRTRLS